MEKNERFDFFQKRNEIIKISLDENTKNKIVKSFLLYAKECGDLQSFNTLLGNLGTKKSLIHQKGFYEFFDRASFKKIGLMLYEILKSCGEKEAIRLLKKYRMCFTHKKSLSSLPQVAIIDFIPSEIFKNINEEDWKAPNGLRFSQKFSRIEEKYSYGQRALLPKLILCAINSLLSTTPWIDKDMDLGSLVHTMRPDKDKIDVNAGYGGGFIRPHTDGYWSPIKQVPLLQILLGIENPYNEPTYFVPVSSIFQIPLENHHFFREWHSEVRDLLYLGESHHSFIMRVIKTCCEPVFNFKMGVLGRDALREVHNVPILEKNNFGELSFRYKSTFNTEKESAKYAMHFINRMIQFYYEKKKSPDYYELAIKPGQVCISLNGSGLQNLFIRPQIFEDHIKYISGSGTIHGRESLRFDGSRIKRTLMRCNAIQNFSSPVPANGGIVDLKNSSNIKSLIDQGYNGADLLR